MMGKFQNVRTALEAFEHFRIFPPFTPFGAGLITWLSGAVREPIIFCGASPSVPSLTTAKNGSDFPIAESA